MSARLAGQTARVALLVAGTLTAAIAAGETNVKFTLDYQYQGPSAPFLLPLDKGYYEAEGLNVSIDPATGSLEAIERVASGNYDMGFADINALIRFRDADPKAPIKAVFILYNRPTYAVIGRKSRGVNEPKDLEGKIIAAPATDNAFAHWPIFTQVNKIDASKVTLENVGFPVREPMLAAGQVDAITGSAFLSLLDLKDRGVPIDDITVLLMANYGVALYGSAIVVNTKFAGEHPEAVKGFLRAFVKGLKETVKRPSNAIETVLKHDPQAQKNLEIERLMMAIRDNIVTPEVLANGYGAIDEERFGRAIDQMGLAYKFKAPKPKPADVFDASFLPPLAERKFN